MILGYLAPSRYLIIPNTKSSNPSFCDPKATIFLTKEDFPLNQRSTKVTGYQHDLSVNQVEFSSQPLFSIKLVVLWCYNMWKDLCALKSMDENTYLVA